MKMGGATALPSVAALHCVYVHVSSRHCYVKLTARKYVCFCAHVCVCSKVWLLDFVSHTEPILVILLEGMFSFFFLY